MTKSERHRVYKEILLAIKRKDDLLFKSDFEELSGCKWNKNIYKTLPELSFFFDDKKPLRTKEIFGLQIICLSFCIEMTKNNNQKPIV